VTAVGRAILVTGASSGIGAALAHAFAQDGDRLVLVARSAEALETVAQAVEGRGAPRPLVVPADLASPGAVNDIAAAVEGAGLVVDILINNAGYGLHGAAARLDRQEQLGIVDVNVRALTDLTLRALPGMIARRRGGILNVASVAAYVPGPYMAAYYASKAYVLSFTEALAEETRGSGVVVSALCPGPTQTRFGARASFSNGRVVDAYGAMRADEVARLAHAGFRAGDRVIVTGARNKLAAMLGRIAPRGLSAALVAAAQRRRGD
jgi:short-subunit dehydrogenase